MGRSCSLIKLGEATCRDEKGTERRGGRKRTNLGPYAGTAKKNWLSSRGKHITKKRRVQRGSVPPLPRTHPAQKLCAKGALSEENHSRRKGRVGYGGHTGIGQSPLGFTGGEEVPEKPFRTKRKSIFVGRNCVESVLSTRAAEIWATHEESLHCT